MLLKIICFLWGHKFVAKAYIGRTQRVLHAFRGEEDVMFYVLKNHPFCLRCGTKNPAFESGVSSEIDQKSEGNQKKDERIA